VGFVVNKVAWGHVFSEHFGFLEKLFGFPYQFSLHQLLHIHYLSYGAGKIGHLVADVPSGLKKLKKVQKAQ
jgi:hypothetical protein